MSEKKIKVALVGAGGWGYQHARILSVDSRVDFCAIVGRTVERTQKRAYAFGVKPYVDINEMINNEKPDFVNLCLPNEGHFQPTLQIIKAGIPLFVEKPLTFNIKEAETLIEEAEKRDLFFAINFNHRYAQPVQLAKEALEKGKLGKPIFSIWRFGGEGSKGHLHANLIETQCHGFDMLEFLFGPIESVIAQMTNLTGKGFTTITISLSFSNGAVGSLIGSYDSSYAYPRTHFLELNGSSGRIWIEDTVKNYQYNPIGSELGETWTAGYFNDYDREFHRTFDKHWDVMLQSFIDGKEPPVHAKAGYRALQLALAAIESFETKKLVYV